MPSSKKLLPVRNAILSVLEPFDLKATSISWSQGYSLFHGADDRKLIKSLFDLSFDQLRLEKAEAYAAPALETTDLAEAGLFREIVLSRETGGSILFEYQRDHVVHTIHNYLLGWYFLAYSQPFRTEFLACCEKRKLANGAEDIDSIVKAFGEIWVFVSLLHDIGYMFESNFTKSDSLCGRKFGDLKKLETWLQRDVYSAIKLTQDSDIRRILKLAGISPLMRKGRRFARASDAKRYLCDPGPVRTLARYIRRDGNRKVKCRLPSDDLDAFDIWAAHYREFGQPDMARRVASLRTTYDNLLKKGHPGYKAKVLDHGVTGGLLLLKHSTFWFALIFALKEARVPKNHPDFALRDEVIAQFRFSPRDAGDGPIYDATHWWTSVVWGTAATALHNAQQDQLTQDGYGALKLSDDPVAYLGILVDILQEWDRHSIHRLKVKGQRKYEPIGSKAVKLGFVRDTGKIHIYYGSPDKAAKVKSDLDKSLLDWSGLLEIEHAKKVRSRR